MEINEFLNYWVGFALFRIFEVVIKLFHYSITYWIVSALLIWHYFGKKLFEKSRLQEKYMTVVKTNRCPKCGSDAIITGHIDDGRNRRFYSNFFDPGCAKWYDFFSWRGVRVCTLFDCCTGCGLIRTVLEPGKLENFLLRKGDNAFSDVHNADQDSYYRCPHCDSVNIISGELFGLFESSPKVQKNYTLYFNPGYLKFKLRWRYGVRVGEYSYCCVDCGLVYSAIDKYELRKFVIDNCEKNFGENLYGNQR